TVFPAPGILLQSLIAGGTMFQRFVLACALILASVAGAAAQGNPTGTISGHVTDPDGLAVRGATVTAASPALQGVRTAVTSANGDYIIPFLPAGEYEVTVELQGFRTVTRKLNVSMAATHPLDVTLTVAQLAESITVTGNAGEIAATATIASNFKKESLEPLPAGRAPDGG